MDIQPSETPVGARIRRRFFVQGQRDHPVALDPVAARCLRVRSDVEPASPVVVFGQEREHRLPRLGRAIAEVRAQVSGDVLEARADRHLVELGPPCGHGKAVAQLLVLRPDVECPRMPP